MKAPLAQLQAEMSDLPLVAILRGLTPLEAPAIGDVLLEAGFRRLQVPAGKRPHEKPGVPH